MEDCIFKFSMEHDKEKLLEEYLDINLLTRKPLHGYITKE